jgi:IS4 transposase
VIWSLVLRAGKRDEIRCWTYLLGRMGLVWKICDVVCRSSPSWQGVQVSDALFRSRRTWVRDSILCKRKRTRNMNHSAEMLNVSNVHYSVIHHPGIITFEYIQIDKFTPEVSRT